MRIVKNANGNIEFQTSANEVDVSIPMGCVLRRQNTRGEIWVYSAAGIKLKTIVLTDVTHVNGSTFSGTLDDLMNALVDTTTDPVP